MANARPHADPPEHPAAAVEVRLLGGFAVLVDGQLVPARAWGSRKAQHLVKLLALAPGQRLAVDQLADVLWPDLDPAPARRAYYQAAYLARKVLDPAQRGLLPLHQEMLALHAPGGLTIDLDLFRAATRRAEQTRQPGDYEAAIARYTGELLPDDRYADWAAMPREGARQQYRQLLAASATQAAIRRDVAGACGLWQRLLDDDAANEEAHVALMRLYAVAGQRQRALDQFWTAARRPAARARHRAGPSQPAALRRDPGGTVFGRRKYEGGSTKPGNRGAA